MAWPTTSVPRSSVITLRLTADEIADLNTLTKAQGNTSRSDTVRKALRSAIHQHKVAVRAAKNAGPKRGMEPES